MLAQETAMTQRIYYLEEQYADPLDGIAAIRTHLNHGWQIAQIRGPQHGPFAIVYQRNVGREYRDPCRRR
jgi:hypothetical protein